MVEAIRSIAYVPAQTPRLIAAVDGELAAISEGSRVVVLDLAADAAITEIDVGHDDPDVAWIGSPPRLLVLARSQTYQTAYLIDPYDLGTIEARIESTMRLFAVTGSYALLVGPRGAVVLHASPTRATPSQFLTRAQPSIAGAALRHFVVAIPDAIEEWDPERRAVKRRLRLPRTATITALGATERSVWMTSRQEPACLRVLLFVNRGQPNLHELPEPIASAVGHPGHEIVVCIGADTGRLYVVDLDGHSPPRVLQPEGLDRVDSVACFGDAGIALIAARAHRPVVLVGLDGKTLTRTPRRPPAGRPARLDLTRPRAPVETSAVGSLLVESPEPHALAPPVVAARPPGRFVRDVPAAPPVPRLSLSPPAAPASPPLLEPVAAEPVAAEPIAAAPIPQAPPARDAYVPDDSAYPPRRLPPRPVAPPAGPLLAGLVPRASLRRCSPGEYLALLEHVQRSITAVAVRAIARDWDRGRLAFPTHDRPLFEAEVLGIANWRSGLAISRVVESAEALDRANEELAAARSGLGDRLTPLEVLAAEHGLDKLGELVLMHVAAPAIWGELARLYAILANDPTRSTCDEHLLWQLVGDTIPRRELARVLDPEGPLVRHGIVRIGDKPRPFQPLSADPVVVKLLAGVDTKDDGEHGVQRVPATVPLERFLAPRAVIERALADLAIAPPGAARVVVRGRLGSGRRTLLATLAQLARRTLATIDAAMLIRERRIGALTGLLQHANLRGWLPCIDGLETLSSDDASLRATVRELLRDHDGPIAVRLPHHVQPPLEPGYVLIELPTSTLVERAGQWSGALAAHGLAAADVDTLAARFTVGAGTIATVVDAVARTAPADVDAAIEHTMRQHLETKLGAVATRVTRLSTWSQIVLPSDIQDSIVELIARVRHRRKVYDTWGFDRVMTTSRGLTALFQGGPGTGKTLVAGAIANELGLDLYRIDLSRVISKWVGETEQNLAKVFDAAEEGQALILFDEADSLFTKRTEVRSSVDRYANLEVNYLLQRLDSFEGVAILTTNFGTAIDPAFKRRLSCRLTFPFPDDEARERLWRVHLPDEIPRAGKLDLAAIARRYRMSGGYIRNAAVRAAFLAAEEGSPLAQEHLERAIRAEFREGGKLAESGQLE